MTWVLGHELDYVFSRRREGGGEGGRRPSPRCLLVEVLEVFGVSEVQWSRLRCVRCSHGNCRAWCYHKI